MTKGFTAEELFALSEQADRMALALRWAAMRIKDESPPTYPTVGTRVRFLYRDRYLVGNIVSTPADRRSIHPPPGQGNSCGVVVPGKGGLFWPPVFEVGS